MDSDKAILSFFESLKPLTDVDENLQEYLEKEEKRFEKVKKDRKKDRALQKKEAQLKKRKKADKGNILVKLFGTKAERAQRVKTINKWMAGGLALAGGGFAAALVTKYHKEIGDALGPVVEEIGEKVKEMATQAATSMIEKLKEVASKAALSLGQSLKNTIIGLTGIKETKAKMAGGEGFLQARESTNRKLSQSGLNNAGEVKGRQGQGGQRKKLTVAQQEVAEESRVENRRLDTLRKEMESELAKIRNSRGKITNKTRETEIRKQYNDKALRRQVGGPITVPGKGSGDKVPMMLPSGSFVLNRNASSFLGFQTGGEVKEATNVLKMDEALSSLTKGSNDYVKPGGRSVRSGTSWSSIKPDTTIHAYRDSVGVPTIGWGSTYYDSILSGKDPVRMGDRITKGKSDQILESNIAKLARTYKNKMSHWTKMTENQKAGLLSLGYNAPNAPIGSYRNLTAALERGDMVGAANNIKRRGPSTKRIAEEKRLILSGPKDLTTVQAPKPVVAPPPPVQQSSSLEKVGNMFGDMFNSMFNRSEPEQKNVTPVRRQVGGVVNSTQARFQDAQSAFTESVGNKMSPHIVVVKRRPQTPMVTGGSDENTMSSGGVNIVELADKLHRIHSGAKF